MDHLVKIIGPAPSELTLGEFKTKLLIERDRVRRGLEYFKTVTLQRKGRSKVKPKTKLNALVAETGLSPKEIIKALELMRKEKENERRT